MVCFDQTTINPTKKKSRMSHTHLTAEERDSIAHMHALGHSRIEIARELSRDPSTISRELRRNSDATGKYFAGKADRKARRRRQLCKLPWKLNHAPLKEFLLDKLSLKWSPEQIAGQLLRLHPREARMRISIETIYAWIKANKKQGGNIYRQLRQSRKKRRKRYGTGISRRCDPTKKPMDQRPVSARNRSRIGHWESDTIEGQKGTGYIVTHVERKTGYLVASYLPDKKASTLNAASVFAFEGLPSSLIRTLTTDNGSEFSGHRELEQALHCAIYFAPARQPWQRGQNENTNGLLRQYFLKGSDFRKLKAEDIQAAVMELNNRPRKKYQFKSPHELFEPKTRAFQN
nr:IS30 family transposase [Rubinisphaera italica]